MYGKLSIIFYFSKKDIECVEENERGSGFSGTFIWIRLKVLFCFQITIDGEIVTDPDVTLR